MSCFITFEGIDGCGKSTQLKLCAEALQEKGQPVYVTRNPGGTDLGKTLRQILLHHEGFLSSRAELLLYLADRAQHVEESIQPALRAGQVVLCDRFFDSTLAYQGFGRGLPKEEIGGINVFATNGCAPQVTFLFDAEPALLQTRLKNRGAADRLEQEAMAFHQRVREGFLDIARTHPDRVVVLDALQPIAVLHQQVMAILDSRFTQASYAGFETTLQALKEG